MQEVSIEITHDCALKCIFCSSSADHPSTLGELTLDEIKHIIDDAVSCGASIVSISGGEPLLYKNIFSVLEYCRDLKLRVSMYTSGVLFDNDTKRIAVDSSIWKQLGELLEDKLTVIFDFQSCNEKISEYLSDASDSSSLIINSITNAINENIFCEIHVVPMKQNFKEIPDILNFCKKIGIKKVSFLRFVPQGRGAENIDKLELSATEFFELQNILYNAINEFDQDFIRLGHPIDFLFCIDQQCKINPCRGGTDAPLILPNGDIHMCPAWKNLKQFKAGNIADKGLKAVWEKSDFYLKFRELVDNTQLIEGLCKKCRFLEKCKGGCVAQRILLFERLNITFPEVMYLSPDPDCPIINNFTLLNKLQFEDDNINESITINDITSTMIILHEKKTKSYGDAWKKRGEIISILPNIARKIDRLEKVVSLDKISDGENLLDTLVDLCVYCTKYLVFLSTDAGNDPNGMARLLKRFNQNDFLYSTNFSDPDVAKALIAITEFHSDNITCSVDKRIISLLVEKYSQLETISIGKLKNASKDYADTKDERIDILISMIITSFQFIFGLSNKEPTQYYYFKSNIYKL
jgi:radical SAM protein with 4Fe4S-binding SPASM domain